MLYRASGVDSITDYNGFSPCCSREVDRVYLTFSFKATFLFNYYLFDIYFSVLQAVFTDVSAKINTYVC